jgi:tetratricopeptide (TPR) repeat protein
MANAVGGQLGTLAQGMVYCRTLSACVDTFDYRRAIEWTDTIERRAPELGTLGFPGDCRTHRAVLCVVRGEWTRGAAEAELAATEAMAYDLGHTAQALSALGEIRLRQGDLDAARTAFDRADAFGLPLGPGPASLLLATGDAAGAQSAITGALASVPPDALTRARYLPTAVRAAVVVHDLGQAEALETELASIADRFAGPALIAASLDARGAVALARGDTEAAVGHFRGAARRWRAAGAPYEVARSLLETARALEDTGDRPAALREARASRTTFEELGASLDVQTASSFLDATDRGGSQPDTSDG